MIEQGTPEWFDLRRGKVTASRVADVIAKTKSGWSAMRTNYMAELVAERLTGTTAESYSSPAMQWGSEKEPDARAAYEFHHDATADLIGFVEHPKILMSGASPDGLIGNAGLLEIKCPNTATHIETLLGRAMPGKYDTQIQWQLACTDRQWCDFVSFDPRMPEHMRLFVARVERDDETIGELEKLVSDFLTEVDRKVFDLNRLYTPQAKAA